METRPIVPDRKLLARLVLIREEARNMMGGGILDERNDRGLNTLPEAEVFNSPHIYFTKFVVGVVSLFVLTNNFTIKLDSIKSLYLFTS